MVDKKYFTLGLSFWLAVPMILWPYIFMTLSLVFDRDWVTIPIAIFMSCFMYFMFCRAMRIVIFKKGQIRVIGEMTPLLYLKRQYGFRIFINQIEKIEIRKIFRDINSKKESVGFLSFVFGFDAIVIYTNHNEIHRLFLDGFTKTQKNLSSIL